MKPKCFETQRCKHLIGWEVEQPSWSFRGAFYIENLTLPIFLPEAHFILLLVILKSLHSSLILVWQPFVFNQRKMLKQCSTELCIHDTVRYVFAAKDDGSVCVCLCVCLYVEMTSQSISPYFTQNWIMINYDDSTQTYADATASAVSPVHSPSWVSSSIQYWFSVTHGWKLDIQQYSNEYLYSFHGDRILYFLTEELL